MLLGTHADDLNPDSIAGNGGEADHLGEDNKFLFGRTGTVTYLSDCVVLFLRLPMGRGRTRGPRACSTLCSPSDSDADLSVAFKAQRDTPESHQNATDTLLPDEPKPYRRAADPPPRAGSPEVHLGNPRGPHIPSCGRVCMPRPREAARALPGSHLQLRGREANLLPTADQSTSGVCHNGLGVG